MSKDAEVKHDDGDLMAAMIAGVMHSTSRVVASSSFAPRAKAEWECDCYPVGVMDPQQAVQFILLYYNAMYDLVGAALAKLGVEYSKLVSGVTDTKAFDAEMKATLEGLNAGAAV